MRADEGITGGREVCRRCHRPQQLCVCKLFAEIAPIANRTGVIILQHPRERFHPLGTARLVMLGLTRARLELAGGARSGEGIAHQMELPAGTGLLYPHPSAVPLASAPEGRRPAHLLLLDGTWATARRLHRANPWLEELPCYALAPERPGQYRIRGEPDERSLATVEAVVQALRILEPDTAGLEDLLRAFDAMIDAQVELTRARAAGGRRRLRRRQPRPLPRALTDGADRVIVVYVESAPDVGAGRRLVQVTALRPATGQSFERLLLPGASPPDPRQLAHMGLTLDDLATHGVSPERLTRDWAAFAGEEALLVAWNRSALDLIGRPGVPLKAIYCNLTHEACGALDAVVQRTGVESTPAPVRGRAAIRLAHTAAMLTWLGTHRRFQVLHHK